jgi:hypothetical protein
MLPSEAQGILALTMPTTELAWLEIPGHTGTNPEGVCHQRSQRTNKNQNAKIDLLEDRLQKLEMSSDSHLKIRHWFFEFYKRDILVVISSTGKSSIVAHEPVPTPGYSWRVRTLRPSLKH